MHKEAEKDRPEAVFTPKGGPISSVLAGQEEAAARGKGVGEMETGLGT